MTTALVHPKDLKPGDRISVLANVPLEVAYVEKRGDPTYNLPDWIVTYIAPNGQRREMHYDDRVSVLVSDEPALRDDNSILREIADWLVGVGYPYDFRTEPPVPECVRSALVDAWIEHDGPDPHAARDDIAATLAEEGGWS